MLDLQDRLVVLEEMGIMATLGNVDLLDHQEQRVTLECVLVVLYSLLQEKHTTLVKVLQEAKARLMSLNMAHWRIQQYHVLICLWKLRLNPIHTKHLSLIHISEPTRPY